MSILFISGATPGFLGEHGKPLAKSVYQYARKWAFPYLWCDHFDESRPPAWSKVLFIKERILEFDYVLWVDADVWASYGAPSPYILFNGPPDKLVFVASDQNGINTGVLGMRGGRRSLGLLNWIWNQTQFIDHEWYEQAAFHEAQRLEPEIFHSIDKVTWNAYPHEVRENTVFVHFAADKSKISTFLNAIGTYGPTYEDFSPSRHKVLDATRAGGRSRLLGG
jgi:hypothetical protein